MNQALATSIGIAIAGAAGSLARYGVGLAFKATTNFPAAGTLCVNLVGAFALGWVYSMTEGVIGGSTMWKLIIGVGFLGGFTTFSSMMFDADKMMSEAAYWQMAGYLSASLFLGLVAVRLGVVLGKAM